MATSPIKAPLQEWQIWAYRIKGELQATLDGFEILLREVQAKLTTESNGLKSKFERANEDLHSKISDVNKRLLDLNCLIEEVEGNKASLTDQGRQLEALREELAKERATLEKRHKEQVEINRAIRESMQEAAKVLLDLQKQAKRDSDGKDSEIARLKADIEALRQQTNELKALTMEYISNKQVNNSTRSGTATEYQTGRQSGLDSGRHEFMSPNGQDNVELPHSSPLQAPNIFASSPSPQRAPCADDGGGPSANARDESVGEPILSHPQDPDSFSPTLQMARRGHKSYREYINRGAKNVAAALARDMKQLEELYGKKFIWNLDESQWRTQLWEELEASGWDWPNVEARTRKMLEEKQKPRKRSRQYLEY